jgi:hypothetical protein
MDWAYNGQGSTAMSLHALDQSESLQSQRDPALTTMIPHKEFGQGLLKNIS